MHRIVAIVSLFILGETTALSERPNIIFILADDLGWNDVGFHGSNQIPTPNIDALAYTGVILNNYYVAPICTPSRSALMTGKYPIHTGMQHDVLFGAEARGLPLTEKLLPQYLQEAGYLNHIVGKWHLGSWKKEYTPTYRGFLSHLGYWTGHQDYNDHTAMETGMWGLDMRRNLEPAFDLHGKHSTEVFTEEAVKIIQSHPVENPLFLYLAHAAVHSGNDYNPLCARDKDVIDSPNITDYHRHRFAGVLKGLDHSVGQVVEALRMKGILHNSIIVFSTDNGGPAAGFNLNAASNWPLRGVKYTLWEGGVHGAGLIWSPLLGNQSSRVSSEMMHITDWLPTLLSGAGIQHPNITGIDGVDMWKTISENSRSEREEVLHNIDDLWRSAALTVGDWKIVAGSTLGSWDGWYGPSGRDTPDYDAKRVVMSYAGNAVRSIGQELNVELITNLRKQAELKCQRKEIIACKPIESACLFNVKQDPCEYQNMAETYPFILKHLEKRLAQLNATAIPPGNLPVDKKGDPKNFHYVWTNFGDYTTDKITEYRD